MTRRSVLEMAICALVVFSLTLIPTVPGYADVMDLRAGQWSGGAGLGFMGNTPDGTEFALKGQADYFFAPNFSIGPMAQYAGTGNDFLFGLSAQAKYYMALGRDNRMRLVFQAGLGFVRAGVKDDDEGLAIADTFGSFLLPIGVGLDYALSRQVAFTVDFLLNFTSLGQTYRAAGREADLHTNVMPALYVGLRF